MRITQEVDYAFRICAHLANKEGEVVGAPDIAKAECIPERFTLRILRKLNLAGITDAKRGAYGGYYLKKSKYDINLYDIIVAVDGPIEVNRCLREDEQHCSKNSPDQVSRCRFHNKLAYIQGTIINMFKQTLLAEFARD